MASQSKLIWLVIYIFCIGWPCSSPGALEIAGSHSEVNFPDVENKIAEANISFSTVDEDGNVSTSNVNNSELVYTPEDEISISYIQNSSEDGNLENTEHSSEDGNLENSVTTDLQRGDTLPYETDVMAVADSVLNESTLEMDPSALSSDGSQISFKTMSWLDAFMLHHRGQMWILFNSLFMVVWIMMGGFSLYRLFGLAYCSPYLSKTQYLMLHLLIFTAAMFEFVQLIHLCFGSHKGLPLFLTLLLTHTPTPCLAVSLITMMYSVFVSSGLPIFGRYYAPPSVYVSIFAASIIVISIVGDIIVGISRSNICLIIFRVTLNALCGIVFFIFIWNYLELKRIAMKMRRELREEITSASLPIEMDGMTQDLNESKRHLKSMLLQWSKWTLISCVFGILMCIFSFSLSLFFTVSYVPLWAFWALHGSIFVSQIILVIALTFAATITLTHNTGHNIMFRYFFPSVSGRVTGDQAPFIKRGNCIYQRVSVASGPSLSHVIPPAADDIQDGPLPNNINMIPKANVNLKRSATFSCPSPYGVSSPVQPLNYQSPVYPMLSDHILPQNNSFKPNVNEYTYSMGRRGHGLHSSHSFNAGSYRRPYYGHYYTHRRYPTANKAFADDGSEVLASTEPVNQDLKIVDGNINLNPEQIGIANHSLTNIEQNVSSDACTSKGNCNEYNSSNTLYPQAYSCYPSNSNRGFPVTSEGLPVTASMYNSQFPSFSNIRPYKGPVPKKPARFEPMLVKSVIKENPVENVFMPEGTDIELKTMNRQADTQEVMPLDSKSNPEDDSFLIENKISSPINTINGNSNSHTPLLTDAKENMKHHVSQNSPNLENQADLNEDNRDGKSNVETLTDRSSIKTDFTVESESGVHSPDYSSSFDSESMNSRLSVPQSRRFLRRNRSSAADCRSRKSIGEGDSSNDSYAMNGSKWYGTWGGRKKKKNSPKAESENGDHNLKQLSSSKSSLSNLYGKIRTKRSKSMYYPQPPAPNPCEIMNGKSLDDLNSTTSTEKNEDDEEDFHFLPKISEDIDLAAEILESSPTLYNFYSLKRSDLKKRKQERLNEANEINGNKENGSTIDDNGTNGNGPICNGHEEPLDSNYNCS